MIVLSDFRDLQEAGAFVKADHYVIGKSAPFAKLAFTEWGRIHSTTSREVGPPNVRSFPMVWALLAKFLLSKPAWVQAVILGLCTGLFVTAAAEANDRDPKISSTLLLVLASGAVSALLYYTGYRLHSRTEDESGHAAPPWLYAVYAAVWLFGLVAAMMALLGAGGFKVAVLAVVPLVLLAPIALHGIRQVIHRVQG